jgi:predicted metal-binding protein
MKAAPYQNRYGDIITFVEAEKDKVEMSGYNPEWIRLAWPNDYSDAYGIYLNQCRLLEDPDCDYLVDDPATHECRPMSYQEFTHEVENNENYRHYLKHAKSDKTRYSMVDPSGGPYIALGTNIGRYFDDGVKRIVEEIQFDQDKIIFTVSNK